MCEWSLLWRHHRDSATRGQCGAPFSHPTNYNNIANQLLLTWRSHILLGRWSDQSITALIEALMTLIDSFENTKTKIYNMFRKTPHKFQCKPFHLTNYNYVNAAQCFTFVFPDKAKLFAQLPVFLGPQRKFNTKGNWSIKQWKNKFKNNSFLRFWHIGPFLEERSAAAVEAALTCRFCFLLVVVVVRPTHLNLDERRDDASAVLREVPSAQNLGRKSSEIHIHTSNYKYTCNHSLDIFFF